jgi:WD40 repeat protein
MDLVDGPNLASFLKEKPLSARQAAQYLKAIAEAIHYAHERGILHRDLKPSNVLIDANDQPRVTDFGLAKRLEGDSSLTLSGHVLGTPSYTPPEQARSDGHKVGRRSDVYSLGATLYHMLVGRPPFVASSLDQALDQVLNREPVGPRLLNPAVPRDLETICLKCLQKEPSRRYPTARALAEELSRFWQDEPILAHPVSPAEKVWRWCRRKPALATLMLLLLLVGGLGLAGVISYGRRAERGRVELEQSLYVDNLHLANEALEASYVARVRLLLDNIDRSPEQRAMRGWEWRYLSGRMLGDQLAQLEKCDAPLWGVTVSRDGKYLACISENGTVNLWDFKTRKLISSWSAHPRRRGSGFGDNPHALVFASDSRLLITSGDDARLCAWRVPSGTKLAEAEMPDPAVRLAISPDGQQLAGCSYQGQHVNLWDLSRCPPSLIQDWNSGLKVMNDLAFSPNGKILLIGGPDAQSVRRFDISDATHPLPLPELSGSDGPVAVSPDGRWLATALTDQQPFMLWALPSFTPVATNSIPGSQLLSLKFSTDSKTLAIGLKEGRLILWDLAGNHELANLLGHGGPLMQTDFSPDGHTLVSASIDRTVRLWDLAGSARGKWAIPVIGTGYDVNFSPDSKHLVSISEIAGQSGTQKPQRCSVVQLWDVNREHGLISGPAVTNLVDQLVLHACFSPDGSFVAADDGSTLRFLAVPSLEQVVTAGFRLPCWATDDASLTYVDQLGIVRSDSPGAEPRVLIKGSQPFAMAVSPDGGLLAVCGKETGWDIQLRDTRDGRMIGGPLKGHEAMVIWLAFSPDSKTLVSAGWDDGMLGIWDVSKQRRRSLLPGHNGSIDKVAFSPDGRTLATCGSDETVRLWNLARMQEVAVLGGHRGRVNGVALSPDGRWLASTSADGTIRLWLAPSFEEIAADKAASLADSAPGQLEQSPPRSSHPGLRLEHSSSVQTGRLKELVLSLE